MWHVARMGRGERHIGFSWRNLRERDQLEEPAINGSLLKLVFRKWDWRVPWINVALKRDRGRDFVNSVMNIQIL